MLLESQVPIREIAAITGYCPRAVSYIAQRYRESGMAAIEDRRQCRAGAPRLLTAEQQAGACPGAVGSAARRGDVDWPNGREMDRGQDGPARASPAGVGVPSAAQKHLNILVKDNRVIRIKR